MCYRPSQAKELRAAIVLQSNASRQIRKLGSAPICVKPEILKISFNELKEVTTNRLTLAQCVTEREHAYLLDAWNGSDQKSSRVAEAFVSPN